MATNYPGPYELRWNYDAASFSVVYPHQFRLSVMLTADPAAGAAFSTIDAHTKGGGTVTLASVAEGVLGAIKVLFDANTNFTTVELWKYTPGTFAAAYVSEHIVVTNPIGTSVGTTIAYRQDVYTFRTTTGGRAKLDLRHTARSSSARLTYGDMNTDEKAIVNYLIASTSPFIGRDNGFFFVPLHLLGGQNERMFKDVNR